MAHRCGVGVDGKILEEKEPILGGGDGLTEAVVCAEGAVEWECGKEGSLAGKGTRRRGPGVSQRRSVTCRGKKT